MPTGKLGVFRGTLLFGRDTLINILPFFRGTFLFGGTLLFGRQEYSGQHLSTKSMCNIYITRRLTSAEKFP